MPSEKSDAEMRLLLQQIARVERNSPPSYPNYKQGIIAGVIVFLLAAMIAVLLMIGGSNSNFVKIAWKCAAVLSIAVFFLGAFRPQK